MKDEEKASRQTLEVRHRSRKVIIGLQNVY